MYRLHMYSIMHIHTFSTCVDIVYTYGVPRLVSADFLALITNDANQGITRVPGLCTSRNDRAAQPSRPDPPSPITSTIATLNNNITALSSFCFLVTASTSRENTDPIFRLYNNGVGGLMQLGSLTITSSGVTLTLFSSTVTFNVDFTNSANTTIFRQFQICVDNNRAILYEDCIQVGGSQSFSTVNFPSRTPDVRSPAPLVLFQNISALEFYEVRSVLRV